jgi:uncharacterized GH25 family protein
MRALFLATLLAYSWFHAAQAHDVWVESSVALVRVGDRVDVDVKLGNHGNDHRDFKLAGKVSPDTLTLDVISPSGKRYDLKPSLVDLGYAPKEGYWSAPFISGEAGHHIALVTSDRVVNHGTPQRNVRSAKTMWLASTSLDNPTAKTDSYRKPLDLPFEIVLLTDPVLFNRAGNDVEEQLLRGGKPVANQRECFIPRGVELAAGFDDTYERRTDANGKATFTPKEGNLFLIVSHLVDDTEKSNDYQSTKYTAALTLRVPQTCPCCDE